MSPYSKKFIPSRRSNCRRQNRLLILIIVLLSMATVLPAQVITRPGDTAKFGIAIKAKAYGDSVVLRWAPTDGVSWMLSRRKGYSLYRVSRDGNRKDTVLLTPRPLRPMPLDQLNGYAASGNKYIAMAAQALYGKDFTPANHEAESFTEEVQQQMDAFNLRFFVAMQAADMSSIAATSMGLRFVDRKVKRGAVYSYIIKSDTTAGAITVLPGLTTTVNTVSQVAPTPQGLEGLPADHVIELHWYRKQVAGFNYFYVERSDDGGKTYQRLTEDPYFSSFNAEQRKSKDSMAVKISAILEDHHIFIDSVAENYKDYYYRIAGIDAFGDISAYSEPVIAHGVDRKPPAPVNIDSINSVLGGQMLIRWTDSSGTGDLAGYFVARGEDINGPFEPIHQGLLPTTARYFLDSTATGIGRLIYVVASIDTAGNYSYSIPRIGIKTDSIPPERPTGLVGIMDSLGLIGLQWDANREPDLKGYRIYSSYDPIEGFLQVTESPLNVNTYIDSINPGSLNRSIYYKIDAVDIYGNVSKSSEVVRVDKPVVVPPNRPIASDIYADGDAIVTVWVASSSAGVKSYAVYRKLPTDLAWSLLSEIPAAGLGQSFPYRDSTARPNTQYQYTCEAIDLTGIRSEKALAVATTNSQTNVLAAPTGVKAAYQARSRKVELRWDYPGAAAGEGGAAQPLYFVIYRQDPGGQIRQLGSVTFDQRSYTDQSFGKTATGAYRYSVEVHKSGSRERSEAVQSAPVNIR